MDLENHPLEAALLSIREAKNFLLNTFKDNQLFDSTKNYIK